MEFFRIIKLNTTEKKIQESLRLANLEDMSNQIFNLDEPGEQEASIGGLWGEFTLSRSKIKGGLRFALLECPNALSFTITAGYPPEPESLVIHLTINRLEQKPEFIEEINEFLDDLGGCLKDLVFLY